MIRTYTTPTATGDPAAFNAWLSGLGSGEGVSGFNLWLQNGYSDQAAKWGETIAITNLYTTPITPFASLGWTASVYTLQDSDWGTAWTGRHLITYTANTPADYLRPGSQATFGFTADIFSPYDATGPDYQIWVGSGSITDNNGANYFQRAITASVPDGGTTIMLLGGALMGLGALRRKFRS